MEQAPVDQDLAALLEHVLFHLQTSLAPYVAAQNAGARMTRLGLEVPTPEPAEIQLNDLAELPFASLPAIRILAESGEGKRTGTFGIQEAKCAFTLRVYVSSGQKMDRGEGGNVLSNTDTGTALWFKLAALVQAVKLCMVEKLPGSQIASVGHGAISIEAPETRWSNPGRDPRQAAWLQAADITITAIQDQSHMYGGE